jgi:hypothetical protein
MNYTTTEIEGHGTEVTDPKTVETRNHTVPVARPVGVAVAAVGLVIADDHVT